MEDKHSAQIKPLEKKEKVAYELGADGTCLFENGEYIQVNRTMLAFHSQYFKEVFFGYNAKSEIKIEGFDRASFKTFLDCLFGMKEYTMLDALVVYPIAHQYKVKESLEKCAHFLEPTHISENVSHVLNLTTFYKRHGLTNFVIRFIKNKYGVVNFLENKNYSGLLKPSAMYELIQHVDLNSLVWTFVYQWGKNYAKKHNDSNVRALFIESGIFGKLSVAHFESAKAVINFHVMTDKQLLYPNEILFHLEANMLEVSKKLPSKSVWIKMKDGDTLTETIALKPSVFASGKNDLVMFLRTQKILIEPENGKKLKVKARYFYREISLSAATSYDKSTVCWRSDLNFFYRENAEPANSHYLFTPYIPSDDFHFNLFLDNNFENPFGSYHFNSSVHCFEIHSVEVTYIFDFQCRILKTSLDSSKMLMNDDNLYFTRNALID